MRKNNSKGKIGTLVKCPKCGYIWKSKKINKPWICCSRCKRYFKFKKRRTNGKNK